MQSSSQALILADSLKKLSFSELMAVYEEGNRENGAEQFPYETEARRIFLAEQNFYDYLRDDFFGQCGAFYAVWTVNGAYASALRMEPYHDGLLLEALETRPAMRQKGYASCLLRAVLEHLAQQGSGPVYSHVSKRNTASVKTHQRCGFSVLHDYAAYIDGSINRRAYTMICSLKGTQKNFEKN